MLIGTAAAERVTRAPDATDDFEKLGDKLQMAVELEVDASTLKSFIKAKSGRMRLVWGSENIKPSQEEILKWLESLEKLVPLEWRIFWWRSQENQPQLGSPVRSHS